MSIFTSLRHRLLGSPGPLPTLTPLPDLTQPQPEPFPFLSLPYDIRLLIYKAIFFSTTTVSTSTDPSKSPLYNLLFTSHQTRDEASMVFYTMTLGRGLVFDSPSGCLAFLGLTSGNVRVDCLREMRIDVPGGDTLRLEGVWRLLVGEGVQLRGLGLDLRVRVSERRDTRVLSLKGEEKVAWEKEREDMQGALERAREKAQVLERWYERSVREKVKNKRLGSSFRDVDDEMRDSEYDWPSYLGRMKSIKYIAIDGNPADGWNVEFELAVLKLHERMFGVVMEMGVEKGVECYARWGDWFWFGSHGVGGGRGGVEVLEGSNLELR